MAPFAKQQQANSMRCLRSVSRDCLSWVTAQRQPLIQGKVGDREGEGPIHGRTNGEHWLGFQPAVLPNARSPAIWAISGAVPERA